MKKLIPAVLLLALLLTGCQTTGIATTQPSLVTATTQTQVAFDAAVNVIRMGLDLKLIDGATYWRDIDPLVMAGQAAAASMRDDAIAGDVNGVQAASDALAAVLVKLQPYLLAVQSKAGSVPQKAN